MSKEKWPLAHIKHTCYNHLRHYSFTYMSILSTYIHNKRKKKWNFFFVAKNFNFFPFFTPYTSHLANIYTFVIQHKKKFPIFNIHTLTYTYTHAKMVICVRILSSFFFLWVRFGWTDDDDGLVILFYYFFFLFFDMCSTCEPRGVACVCITFLNNNNNNKKGKKTTSGDNVIVSKKMNFIFGCFENYFLKET